MYHTPDPQAIIDSINSFPVPPPLPLQPDRGSHSEQTTEEEINKNMHYKEKMGKWFCKNCEKDNFRKKRMRDHVAHCLGFRLYICDESCGVDDWYEPLLI